MATLVGGKGPIVGIANEHSLAHGCARHWDGVGALAAFLVSEGARAITGTIAYVDAGLHVLG